MSRVANAGEANFLGHLVDKSLGGRTLAVFRRCSSPRRVVTRSAVALTGVRTAEGPRVETPVRPRDRLVAPSPWEAELVKSRRSPQAPTEQPATSHAALRAFLPPRWRTLRCASAAVRAFAAESPFHLPGRPRRWREARGRSIAPADGPASADEPASRRQSTAKCSPGFATIHATGKKRSNTLRSRTDVARSHHAFKALLWQRRVYETPAWQRNLRVPRRSLAGVTLAGRRPP
jgi:hypothetical protein